MFDVASATGMRGPVLTIGSYVELHISTNNAMTIRPMTVPLISDRAPMILITPRTMLSKLMPTAPILTPPAAYAWRGRNANQERNKRHDRGVTPPDGCRRASHERPLKTTLSNIVAPNVLQIEGRAAWGASRSNASQIKLVFPCRLIPIIN